MGLRFFRLSGALHCCSPPHYPGFDFDFQLDLRGLDEPRFFVRSSTPSSWLTSTVCKMLTCQSRGTLSRVLWRPLRRMVQGPSMAVWANRPYLSLLVLQITPRLDHLAGLLPKRWLLVPGCLEVVGARLHHWGVLVLLRQTLSHSLAPCGQA